nr:hypothetical protein [Tanacetum cinerariifolium]
MDTTIDQQVAVDEALIPHACRLRIGRSNFRLLSDISSKESNLQLVYDVLHLTPFFKAFLVTADVLEIYMEEFWATTTVHHHSIRFKMDNKKHIVNLESLREMLHICSRLHGQTFDEPPFEEKILAFLRSLGHIGEIKRLTDVNINKLHQPWRSFAAVINKCISRKSSGYDSLRLSQAQILWGFYHKRNTKSSSDTTVTSPPTATAGTRLFTSAKGKQPATASKAKSLTIHSDVAMTEAQQLKLATKRSLQQTHISQASGSGVDEGTEEDDDQEDEGDDDEDDQKEGSDDEQAFEKENKEFIHPSLSTHDEEETKDEESFDPIPKTPKNTNDEGNEYDKFLKTIDENMQKIIKEKVKEQALVEAYEYDKIILDTYGDTVTLKRHHDDDADKDKEPSDGSDRRSKRRREGKEPESASAPKEKATRSAGKSTQGSKSRQTSVSESAIAEEPMQTTHEMEEPSHLEFETGANDQPIVEPSQRPKWFSQQKKPPTPNRYWNKTLPATHGSIQPLVELEFFLEEVYKATTDQLDWVNLEGQQYLHNLLKPLPLIPNSRVRRVIPFDHFINNDLEYLRGGASSRKYTTSVTKTKAADYGHIKWIKDLVPRTMWIQEPVGYDKHALWGISHWGCKRPQL